LVDLMDVRWVVKKADALAAKSVVSTAAWLVDMTVEVMVEQWVWI
jgi:hypothetical protein